MLTKYYAGLSGKQYKLAWKRKLW